MRAFGMPELKTMHAVTRLAFIHSEAYVSSACPARVEPIETSFNCLQFIVEIPREFSQQPATSPSFLSFVLPAFKKSRRSINTDQH